MELPAIDDVEPEFAGKSIRRRMPKKRARRQRPATLVVGQRLAATGNRPRLGGERDDANRQHDGHRRGGEDQIARVVDRFADRRVDEDDDGGEK